MSKQELHARVSTAAHSALHEFADEQGFTVTALIEEFAGSLDGECALALAAGARRTSAARRRRLQPAGGSLDGTNPGG